MIRKTTLASLALAAAGCAEAPTVDAAAESPWAPEVGALTPIGTPCEFSEATGLFKVTLKDGESALVSLSAATPKTLTVNQDKCSGTAALLAKVKSIEVVVDSGEPTVKGVRVLVDQSAGPLVKGSAYKAATATAAAIPSVAGTKVALRGASTKDELWVRGTSKADTLTWVQTSADAGTGAVASEKPTAAKSSEKFVRDIAVTGAGSVSFFVGEGDDSVDASAATVPVRLYGGDGADVLTGGTQGDQLSGGAGADNLLGRSGDDMLTGEEGDDVLDGGDGCDGADGGPGTDSSYDDGPASYQASVEASFASSVGACRGPIPSGLAPPANNCTNGPKFNVNADDTVTQCNGLVWQRIVPPATYDWQGALNYCDGLTLGGSSDWRVPTPDELSAMGDKSRINPAIDPDTFPFTPVEKFWSGTPWAPSPAFAWYVDFSTDYTYYGDVANTYRVRCVR